MQGSSRAGACHRRACLARAGWRWRYEPTRRARSGLDFDPAHDWLNDVLHYDCQKRGNRPEHVTSKPCSAARPSWRTLASKPSPPGVHTEATYADELIPSQVNVAHHKTAAQLLPGLCGLPRGACSQAVTSGKHEACPCAGCTACQNSDPSTPPFHAPAAPLLLSGSTSGVPSPSGAQRQQRTLPSMPRRKPARLTSTHGKPAATNCVSCTTEEQFYSQNLPLRRCTEHYSSASAL